MFFLGDGEEVDVRDLTRETQISPNKKHYYLQDMRQKIERRRRVEIAEEAEAAAAAAAAAASKSQLQPTVRPGKRRPTRRHRLCPLSSSSAASACLLLYIHFMIVCSMNLFSPYQRRVVSAWTQQATKRGRLFHAGRKQKILSAVQLNHVGQYRQRLLNSRQKSMQHVSRLSTTSRLFATTSPISVSNESIATDPVLDDDLDMATTNHVAGDDDMDDERLRSTNHRYQWRSLPELNPTIEFKTWIIPKGKSLQKVITNPLIQPYLATRHELQEHMHGRVKVVRDFPDDYQFDQTDHNNKNLVKTSKLVLLHPDTPPWEEIPESIRNIVKDCHGDGPTFPISLEYHNFTASYILQKVLPPSAHPPPTAFETIGHVAHLNLRARHLPYRFIIGQILVDTLPTIETVIHKVGEVQGPYRTYDLEVLAGRPETEVVLTESGITLHFDVKDVYWCSRLSEERQRLLRSEIQDNQWVVDAFCGVGALVLQAAKQKNCRITANDWNPAAVAALRENIARNGVAENFQDSIHCGEAYEFLMDVGSTKCTEGKLPDHILMNYPLEAPSFLGALRWWPVPRGRKRKSTKNKSEKGSSAAKDELHAPRVHVYTFARADAETNRTAEETAVDIIAEELLPMGGATHRWQELNEEYNCDLKVHHVRDVAPGKLVLCISFSATNKLLRYMQGDFS